MSIVTIAPSSAPQTRLNGWDVAIWRGTPASADQNLTQPHG